MTGTDRGREPRNYRLGRAGRHAIKGTCRVEGLVFRG